jgi:phospholipid/cholesterol/gamma-HCH transport system substrate-binding protein
MPPRDATPGGGPPMKERRREFKVGLLIIGAIAVLALGIFLIGRDDQLFRRKNRYRIHFDSVSGLNVDNPVQLNGVTVGGVEEVVLPEDMGQNEITVWISVDRRYRQRVRADSSARIRTLGLLGDKYVSLSSGSPEFPEIPSGGEIPAAEATSVDQLLASGEDMMANVVSISHSLSSILGRMERGEGMLGQLTVESEEGDKMRASLTGALDSIQRIAGEIENGRGPLGRMIGDEALGNSFAGSIARFEAALGKLESGPGVLPAMLNDPQTKARFDAALDNLGAASKDVAAIAADFKSGDGLLPRLVHDEQYGREITDELRQLVQRLNLVASRLEQGEGTAGKLISDPAIYEAVNDIIIGINESKLLRWLIRNRQQKGIEKRYGDEQRTEEAAPPG